MATAPVLPQVSVEEYEQTPALFDRHEYVDGHLIEKAVPTWKHSQLQGWLSILFWKHYVSLVAGPELHSKVQNSRWRIPDFAIQTAELAQGEEYALKPLLLAIEIRSPEDRWSDLLAKFEDYHQWGVPYCWLLDPEGERAWTFHKAGDLEEIRSGESITAGEIVLAMPEVFSVFHRR